MTGVHSSRRPTRVRTGGSCPGRARRAGRRRARRSGRVRAAGSRVDPKPCSPGQGSSPWPAWRAGCPGAPDAGSCGRAPTRGARDGRGGGSRHHFTLLTGTTAWVAAGWRHVSGGADRGGADAGVLSGRVLGGEDRSAPPGPPSGPRQVRRSGTSRPAAPRPPAAPAGGGFGGGSPSWTLATPTASGRERWPRARTVADPLLVRLEDGVASMTTISFPDDWTALRTVESDGVDGGPHSHGRPRLDAPARPPTRGSTAATSTTCRPAPEVQRPSAWSPSSTARRIPRVGVGSAPGGGRWEVRAWEALRRWQAIGRGPSLRLTRPPGRASLLADSQGR